MADHRCTSGLTISPEFIDVHTHDDGALLKANPKMTAKVSQGVTTVIVGNCGISLAPIAPLDPPPPLNLLGDRYEPTNSRPPPIMWRRSVP